MTKRSRERLLRLAGLLDTVPVEHFNLSTWAETWRPCETAGCAVGWAAADPWFRRRGLRLSGGAWPYPVFRDEVGFEAVEAFFGLTRREAAHLFVYSSYRSGIGTRPKTVANRIRRFVERTGP